MVELYDQFRLTFDGAASDAENVQRLLEFLTRSEDRDYARRDRNATIVLGVVSLECAAF